MSVSQRLESLLVLLLAYVDILAELVDQDGVRSSLVRRAADVCSTTIGRPAE